MDTVISMHDVDAFEDEVSAYPAVVVLRNQPQAKAAVVDANKKFGESDARALATWVRRGRRPTVVERSYEATRVDGWFAGRDLWPTGSPSQLALIADLESRFPPLQDEATGTRVGIGVATGCDDVFITSDPDLVEQDLHDNDRRLRSRHVARKRPATWYRTIDRVDHRLTRRPKLVLPDLKAAAHPVLDEGRYYPHHNLYYVVSDTWDPEVLGGLLLSDIANLFVGAYCVRMRGGTSAFASRDRERATAVAAQLYGITDVRARATGPY